MTDSEENTLIRRIAEGDQEAMMAFYDRFFGLVAGFCRRTIQDPGTADEVIQDTFWQVWRQSASYDAERARVSTWVLMMARSRCLDALRRSARVAPTDPWDDVPERLLATAGDEVPAHVEGRLDQERVQAAFQTLPDAQRSVVLRVYLQGKTAQQVAEEQEVPLGTVKTRLRLALDKLRRVLEVHPDGS